MLTLDNLRAYGANIEEGMGRCFYNESFYLRLVGMGLADANFDKLAAAVEANDVKNAFEAVHALKGSIGNLALSPIYNPICEMTEMLRGQTEMVDISDPYERMMEALAEGRKLLD